MSLIKKEKLCKDQMVKEPTRRESASIAIESVRSEYFPFLHSINPIFYFLLYARNKAVLPICMQSMRMYALRNAFSTWTILPSNKVRARDIETAMSGGNVFHPVGSRHRNVSSLYTALSGQSECLVGLHTPHSTVRDVQMHYCFFFAAKVLW